MPEPGKVIPVRVAVRCRPLIPKELSEGCQQCLTFVKGEPQVLVGHNRAFTYDYTFGPETAQEAVYCDAVKDLVAGLFKGYNATVLAYGQTGSGKTYSMGTAYDATLSEDEDMMGVIPRVLRDLFDGVKERDDAEFTIKVTFLEIYNEDLKDLLNMSTRAESLMVREDPGGSIKLPGLQEVQVNNLKETMQCLEQGSKGRTTGATAMNATSSRSHAIFSIIVEQRKKEEMNDLIRCKFHLVDLAGSERAKRTQAEGDRFREGISINKGLLCLGNVISALGEDGQKPRHIPYRDSKLTRLLQDSLGGNSHTVMIACVSPADSNMEETINTLRYADRARKIKNKPIINRDPQMAEIMRLRQLVQDLQVQIVPGSSGPSTSACSSSRLSEGSTKILKDRNKHLQEENHKLAEELRVAVDQNAAMCEKVVCAELARDDLKEKLAALRCQANHHFESLNASLLNGDHTLATEHLNQMKGIQEKITELENLEPAEDIDPEVLETSQDFQSGDGVKTEEDKEESAKYALRQAKLGRELQELNKMLTKKQELATKMAVNEAGMESMKQQYEETMMQLEQEVSRLQAEKDNLTLKLHDAKTSNASSKVSEQRRKRLVELESDLSQLKKKMVEQSKLLKVKDQTDKQCSKLGQEIQSMKQHRVRLMKQMKEDAEMFRKWRQQKDKEVLQLKAKDRKRQFELVKLERDYSKQQQVLRRKADEAASANRRLKEALQKQKYGLLDREKQLKVSDKSGIGQRVRNWLSRDLEVQVSLEEAKLHLNSLLLDRKELTQQLAELKEKLTEPPKKRQAWSECADDEDASHAKTKSQISELKNDLRLCNAQISDFQQRLVDADQDEVKKMRWASIRTMVEAKCALKWLMNTAVTAKVECTKQKSNAADVKTNQDDMTSAVEKLENEIAELKRHHEQEKTEVQRQHQEKVLYLLKQLQTLKQDDKTNTTLDEDTKERLKFQEEEIERLAKINEELEERNEECSTLKKELTVLKYKGLGSGNVSLMPSLCDVGSSPFVFATPAHAKKAKVNKKPPPPKMEIASDDDDDDWIQDSDDDAFDYDTESDYYPTPLKPKPKYKRQTTAHGEGDEEKPKTSSKGRMCMCKTGCSTKRCSCRTGLAWCNEACGCIGCKNMEEIKPDSTMGIDKESDSILENTASTVMGDSKVELNTTFCVDDKSPAITNKTENSPKTLLGDLSNQTESPLKFKETAMVTSLFPRKKKSGENCGPLAKRKRQLLPQGPRFFPGLSD